MTKLFCIAVLMSLCVWSFAAPGFTTKREIRNLVGPKRIPNKKLSPGQVALKNVIAMSEGDWEAYCETLSPELAAEWRKDNVIPSSGVEKRSSQAIKIIQMPRIVSTKKKSGAVIVVVEERIQNRTNVYTMTLKKSSSGWLIVSKEEETSSSVVRK